MDTFSVDDILTQKDGITYWKGVPLDETSYETIKEQAKGLKDSFIFKVLKAEIEWYAIKSLIEKGKTEEDIRIARMYGDVMRVMKEKLEQLAL